MEEIAGAIKWVTPFAETIRDEGLAALKQFRNVKEEDAHNIQTHINSIYVLDKAQALQASRLSQLVSSRLSATPETPTDLNAVVTMIEVAAPSTRRSRKRQSIEPVPAHLVEPKRLAPEASFPATPETSPLALSSSSSLSPNVGEDSESARRPFAPLKDEEDSTGSSLSATDLAEEIDLPHGDDLQPKS